MHRWISIFLALTGGLLIWAAGTRQAALLTERERSRLTQAAPLENAPPLVVFSTIALGGFQGLVADALWLRAQRLQDEGRYFELVQLADWITKLEPRFTSVWTFQAWNMAYNVSVIFDDPADRWRWVRNGIVLLRDGGLKYNAGSAGIYRELGWLFLHKIGDDSDQAHWYYKRAWAEEMQALLGGPRPDYAHLAPAVRARMLAEYRLDPGRMQDMEREFGPLDWRLPYAHAVYWAWRGRPHATGFDALSCDRMMFQGMAENFRRGALVWEPGRNLFALSPNLDALPWVRQTYERALRENPDARDNLNAAYRYFLRDAAVTLYTQRRPDQARELFDYVAKNQPGADTAEGFEAFIARAFLGRLGSPTPAQAQATVAGALAQSLFWQTMGQPDRAAGFEALARLTYAQYTAARTNDAEFLARTGLPPFGQLRESARQQVAGELEKIVQPAPARPAADDGKR